MVRAVAPARVGRRSAAADIAAADIAIVNRNRGGAIRPCGAGGDRTDQRNRDNAAAERSHQLGY
jgi:hypothetical protein